MKRYKNKSQESRGSRLGGKVNLATILTSIAIGGSLICASSAVAKHFDDYGFHRKWKPRVKTQKNITIEPIGTYLTTLGEDSAEVVAYRKGLMFVTNSDDNSFDIVNINDLESPELVTRVSLEAYGAGPNSIAVHGKIVAVAVESDPQTDPGQVIFFNLQGNYLNQVTVGALPDMLTFTANGKYLLVANEGEAEDGVNPAGTVSIIHMPKSMRKLDRMRPGQLQKKVRTADFDRFTQEELLANGVRLLDKEISPSLDLEPEYITVSDNSRYAWIALQENNAIALLDIKKGRFLGVRGLGYKDHSLEGNGLDASDKDNLVNITLWPVLGMYQPDAIASFRIGPHTYILTANEGDARDEDKRISKLTLDPGVFPDADELQQDEYIGRLEVSTLEGDIDGDGDFDQLFSYGGRSFSIFTSYGDLVYDSGDEFEQIAGALYPANFNSDNDENSFDTRSDAKGIEPEAVTVGKIKGRSYAFVGLERMGGIMVYDVSEPWDARFVQYSNSRDFSGEAGLTDSAPEILKFIPKGKSPNNKNLLLAANEVSGSVTIYQIGNDKEELTLTLLHNNDGESSLLPFSNEADGITIPVGGIAAFKSITDREISDAREQGNSVLNVYAGDAFLASATLSCSMPPNDVYFPYDGVAQRQIGFDAHIFGNHEFDFSPDFLERFIHSFEVNGVLNQPFLSANLDFSSEPGFGDLIDEDGLLTGYSADGKVVARSKIVADKVTGKRFGVVGATTPFLATISSPRNVQITSTDLAETAEVVQEEIDRLMQPPHNVSRIIFVSHLQSLLNDAELMPMLRGVDVAVAGGGDELLVNPDLPLDQQLLPGEEAEVDGDYPLVVEDMDGREVYIVTTAGNYKYLGRLDVSFDASGEVIGVVSENSYPRRVIPISNQSDALGLDDAVEPDDGIIKTVIDPLGDCLEDLAEPIVGSDVELDLLKSSVRGKETNSGNLVADAYLYAYDQFTDQFGLPPRDYTVIAVQNGGGIRQNAGDSLPNGGAPGTISRQNTLDVLAFLTNSVTVVQNVSPEDAKSIFERAASRLPIAGGQFLQVGGVSLVYDINQTAQVIEEDGTVTTQGQRVESVTLADGTEIVSDGAVVSGAPSITIVTNSFIADGGDIYPWLAAAGKVQLPLTYEQAWVDYMLSFPAGIGGYPTIPAADGYQNGGEGRITVLTD